MKGIILAGGTGSRLWPITNSVSKQLLPVYDKPMIYYPLTTMMLAGIREVLLITSRNDQAAFKKLLGVGDSFGITISYAIQEKPEGIAQSLLIAKGFLSKSPSLLILGDNIFHGTGLGNQLQFCFSGFGAMVGAFQVSHPEEFGVIEFGSNSEILSLEEKPVNPKSNWVTPGIYFYDSSAPDRAGELKKSQRGEYEITDLNRSYLSDGLLGAFHFPRGSAWLDMGNPNSLLEASEYVRALQERQGNLIGSPHEVALNNGWITDKTLARDIESYSKTHYGKSLIRVLNETGGYGVN
jgi:glucose-1-phosphate thymidylyltransferase